jgi:NAD(P)H-dependent FMN reductase
MQNERPLNIPVLLGTIRKGRASAHVARFLLEQVREREGVVTGLLKHVLDSNLTEYVHKAVGIAGVSAGPFGGTRVIQNCIAPMRELGFVTIFFDLNFSTVLKTF